MNEVRFNSKAANIEDQTDSVVISFDAKWHNLILEHAFRIVIRKRIPKKIDPAYLEELLKFQHEICLSDDEIRDYASGRDYIGCYQLGEFQNAKKPITITELNKTLLYYPPQNFLVLSKSGKEIIDGLAGF